MTSHVLYPQRYFCLFLEKNEGWRGPQKKCTMWLIASLPWFGCRGVLHDWFQNLRFHLPLLTLLKACPSLNLKENYYSWMLTTMILMKMRCKNYIIHETLSESSLPWGCFSSCSAKGLISTVPMNRFIVPVKISSIIFIIDCNTLFTSSLSISSWNFDQKVFWLQNAVSGALNSLGFLRFQTELSSCTIWYF